MGKYIESDIQIRFADADSLGHINNVNLQHYFDVGKMEFYEKVLGKTIDPDAESLILVSIHTNYHRQSRLHSQLVVRTWVEKIGNSSVTIFQHLIAPTAASMPIAVRSPSATTFSDRSPFR